MQEIDLCISLISTNTAPFLNQCLKSIYESETKSRFEIYVVDNASNDGTSDLLKLNFPNVRIITNSHREGYGANHNKVLLNNNARYTLVLNEDTIIKKGAIDTMIEFMNLTPDAGLCGCKVFYGNGDLQYNIGKFPSLWGEFTYFGVNTRRFKLAYEEYKFMMHWNYNERSRVDWISGCCLVIRNDIVKQVGGFNEEIFIYFEDTELSKRINKQTNYRTYFIPEASIIHFHGQSFDPQNFKREKYAFDGSCIYFRTAYGRFVEIIYKTACQICWLIYFSILSIVIFVFRITKQKVLIKRDFYRFLLFGR